MRLLGVDTSTPIASVALIEDHQLIAEAVFRRATGSSLSLRGNHAEVVLPLIASVLAKAQLSLQDIGGLAVAIGPGSFTGLRIGLATVKGIAYDCNIPVAGVSTLQAQAARVIDGDGFICAMLDARKHEVYAALFERQGKQLERLSEDRVLAVASLAQLLSQCDGSATIRFIGDGALGYREQLVQTFPAQARILSDDLFESVASAVARLALVHFQIVTGDDLGALAPLYLRSTEAEVRAGKMALTS